MFKGTRRVGTADFAREAPLLARLYQARTAIDRERGAVADARRRRRSSARVVPRAGGTGGSQSSRRSGSTSSPRSSPSSSATSSTAIYSRHGAVDANAATSNDFTAFTVTVPGVRARALVSARGGPTDRTGVPGLRRGAGRGPARSAARGGVRPHRVHLEAFEASFWASSPYHHPIFGWPSDLASLAPSDLERFFDPTTPPTTSPWPWSAASTRRARGPGPRLLRTIPSRPGPGREHGRDRSTPPPPGGGDGRHHPYGDPPLARGALLPPRRLRRRPPLRPARRPQRTPLRGAGRRAGPRHRRALRRQPAAPSRRPGRARRRGGGRRTHAEVEEAMLEEVDRLQSEPVPEGELARARTRAVTDRYRLLRSSQDLLLELLSAEALGDPRSPTEAPARLAAVTAEDILRVARAYLTRDGLNVLSFRRPEGPGGEAPFPPTSRRAPTLAAAGLLLLAACAGSRPPAAPDRLRLPPAGFAPPEAATLRYELANGTPVYALEDHELPLVTLTLLFRGGAVLDPPGREGLAELTAAVWPAGGAGSAPPPSSTTPSTASPPTSGSSSAIPPARSPSTCFPSTSSPPWTCSTTSSAGRASRRTASPRPRPTPFRPCRPATTTRRRSRSGSGAGWSTGRAPGRPAPPPRSRWTPSPPRTVAGCVGTLVRAGNVVVALAGNFDPAAARSRLLELTLGHLPAMARELPPVPAPGMPQPPGVWFLDQPGRDPGPHPPRRARTRQGDPDELALLAVTEVLGGGFTSRLVRRVRSEEGLAYDVTAAASLPSDLPGEVSATFQTASESAPFAVAIALEELRDLTLRGSPRRSSSTPPAPSSRLPAAGSPLPTRRSRRWPGPSWTAARATTGPTTRPGSPPSPPATCRPPRPGISTPAGC